MTKDLTKGRIMPILVSFTIPLILGNIFQLTYNAVDGIIVGNFVGKEALAAVGICNPIMTLMILFLNGLCIGAGILMGTQYGAGDYDTLRREISTTMLAGASFSLVLSVVCILLASPILQLMQVETEIFRLTRQYLRIVFLGLVFTFLYNFFSSTLRALGDSRTPLYFLIASAVLNVLGDLFFVIVLNLGSAGCAIATVISEALCCLFCLVYIRKNVEILQLGKKWLVFDRSLLKKTVSYGWASAMQQATVQLGKICVQSITNTMGVPVIAAFAAVNRLDDFAIVPEQNIAHAMTAFMAQNRGAGKKERVTSGFFSGLILETAYSVLLFLICFFGARPLMGLFSKDEEVILHGVRYLHLISFMYILPAVTNAIQGYFRGIGKLKVTLLSSFVNMGVRVVFAVLLVFGFHMGIESLPFSYMAGWFGMMLVELPILFRNWKENWGTAKGTGR